jgi:hypothetical protein
MGPAGLSVDCTCKFDEKSSSHVATSHVLVGVFGHLLFEQLVCRILSYHGGHDGYVLLGMLSVEGGRVYRLKICREPSTVPMA